MNVLYLLKTLGTNKLSELVDNMDLPPLDIQLALWGAIAAGEIEVNENKDRVTVLKEAQPSSDPDLSSKLLRVIQHYSSQEKNITRGLLNQWVKDPTTGQGYPWQDYIMALQHLIDDGIVVEEVLGVSKTKKRPYHKFVFLGLPENDNREWNAREVNKWIAQFESDKVK